MGKRFTFAVSFVGAAALIGSVLTSALASQPPPMRQFVRGHAGRYSVNGSLTVTNVLKVNKNLNVSGNLYGHGKAEIYKGLLVRQGGLNVLAGGLKADSLNITGPMQAQSATIAGNLNAGAISGTSLTLTGAATVNGKVAGNGVDAGAGGLTTTGAVQAGSLTASGALSAGSATFNGLTVTGTVNFTGATVTGLSTSTSGNATNLTVSNLLTAGSTTSSSNPLTLNANGKSASLGVNSLGALTVQDLSVAGTLSLAGTAGLTTPSVQAPTSTTGTNPALTLTGNGITLNGSTTLNNGSDLNLSAPTAGQVSHIVAGADKDVAGTLSFIVPANAAAGTEISNPPTVTFAKAYTTKPVVVLTPLGDPQPGTAQEPKVYITITGTGTSFTGFTAHYVPTVSPTAQLNPTYNYIVIGSSS